MAELLPNWLQENCYPAQYDRLMLGNLVCSEGVADVGGGSLLVTTGGSGLELDVAQGGGWVEGDDDDRGMYSIYNDAPVTLTATAADPTNPRIDQVIARVYDSTYGEGADEWVLEMLDGTATGGATLSNLTGAAALPDNSIRLAYILVPATFAGPFVNATHIKDARVEFAACGGEIGTLTRVHRSAAFTVPTAIADLVFDTVSFGNAALFNTATGVYTAPATGFYRVSVSVNATAALATRYDGQIVKGVTVQALFSKIWTTTSNDMVTVSTVVSASAGDQLFIRHNVAAGGAWTGNPGTSSTYASFERIG